MESIEDKALRSEDRSNYIVSLTQRPFENKDNSIRRKRILKVISKIFLFIIAIIGAFWTVIQIIESDTFKNLISK